MVLTDAEHIEPHFVGDPCLLDRFADAPPRGWEGPGGEILRELTERHDSDLECHFRSSLSWGAKHFRGLVRCRSGRT